MTQNEKIINNISLTQAHATALLEQWLGSTACCQRMAPLEGGICSSVFLLEFDRPPRCAVVKLCRDTSDDPLPRERLRLDYLRQHTSMPCPRVYLQDDTGQAIPHSFLLLENVPGVNLARAGLRPAERTMVEYELAEALCELHSHTRDSFGDFAAASGATDWIDIFIPRLEELRQELNDVLSPVILNQLDQALSLVANSLRSQGEPSLVHNDLSPGNIMVQERGDGWHLSGILDPVGMQYADTELELAYLEVFNIIGRPFFDAYSREHPLRAGYGLRKLFYWLHTDMLHIWLGLGTQSTQDRVLSTSRQITAKKVEGE